jgi:hypothetical protein
MNGSPTNALEVTNRALLADKLTSRLAKPGCVLTS